MATPKATTPAEVELESRLASLERGQLNTSERLRAIQAGLTQHRRILDGLRAARIEADTRQMTAEVKAIEARLAASDLVQADLERRVSAFELLRLQKRHPVG